MFQFISELTTQFGLELPFNLDLNYLQDFHMHVYWKNSTGTILGCNDRQAKDVGFSEVDHLLGLNDFDIFPEKEALNLKHNDTQVMKTETPNFFIEPVTIYHEKKMVALSHKAPFRLRSKKVVGIVGFSFIFEEKDLSLTKMPMLALSSANQINLTQRQLDCLFYLINGMTIKQIAHVLHLSCKTVEYYLAIIKRKLNCKTRTQLIQKALQIPSIRERL